MSRPAYSRKVVREWRGMTKDFTKPEGTSEEGFRRAYALMRCLLLAGFDGSRIQNPRTDSTTQAMDSGKF